MDFLGVHYHYATVKYDRSGVQQWVNLFTRSSHDDIAVKVAVDDPGNTVVTGSSFNPSSDFDIVTLCYNSSGNHEWTAVYNRPDNNHPIEQDKLEKVMPGNFTLHQNFPNPFNPVTSIKFDVFRSSKVKLVVYNELGVEISTLVDDNRDKGSYEIKFDMSGYASGTYFYVMTANEERVVKKMILTK